MINKQIIRVKLANKFNCTLIMRLLLFLITLNLTVPAFGYSHTAKVSLDLKNATLKDVFHEIENQTEYLFFYYEGLIDNNTVNVTAKNETVKTVLEDVLNGKDITYTIKDRQIYLVKKEEATGRMNVSPIPVIQQERVTVKGVVLDEYGEPLAGVNITVEGSTRGVATDIDGSFSIDVLPSDKLAFRYLGMRDELLDVGNKQEFTVVMKEKTDELDEVTVVAFAKQKKESVLASISTVRPAELKVPSSNLTTALAGRVAGLISYQRSGEPGQDDAAFFVRGVTSFTYAGGGPLILIDGVEMTSSDLARLQPDDIASFSIMKDATASALYGARGANGVILVTTKEGREGNATITARYETSISQPTKEVNLVDPITYMRKNNEAVLTRDKIGTTPYPLEKIDNTLAGRNPMVYPAMDWQDLLLKRQTINHRINFNLSGGGQIARYYIAATFNKDNGIMNVDKRNNFNNNIDLKRYLLRSNVNINVTKTTEAIVRLHGTFDDYSGPIDGGSDLYKKILRTDPVLYPAYYEPDAMNVGTKHILFGNHDKGQYINPYADMVKGYTEYSKSTMLAQFELKQDLNFITQGLNVRGLFNTTRYSYFDVTRYYNPFYYSIGGYDKYEDEYTLFSLNPTTGTDYLLYYPGTKDVNSVVYIEAAVDYNRTFAEKHGVSGLLVFTTRSKLNGSAETLTLSLPHRNVGLAGRFTYNYDMRYFLEANFGYNGSERFAKHERFGFFPSIGIGWILTNEAFFPQGLAEHVNMLKLKATYGLVGNDAIGDEKQRFFYLSEVNMSDNNYGVNFGEESGYYVSGISINKYPNDKITWERSQKMNLGIEMRLFDMMDIQAEYYTEHRSNILQQRSFLPANMGLMVTPSSNVGEAKAHGLDLSLDMQKYFNKDFWMSGRVNFTYATSEYTKYEEVDQSNTPWLSHIGQPIRQQWGYVAERLFVDEEEVANSPMQFGDYMAGDIKYRDINGDGQITTEDRIPIGFPTEPEVVYGFGISTGYKNIDFSCFFQGLARESFWIDVSKTAPFVDTDGNGGIISKNTFLKVYNDDHWTEANRNIYALWPRLSDHLIDNNNRVSSWFMRDGSFMRLKSLELGYSIPKMLAKKIFLQNCRIYLSGTNLLTSGKFKMWDPEMAGEGLGYPPQRVYNMGVQVTF